MEDRGTSLAFISTSGARPQAPTAPSGGSSSSLSLVLSLATRTRTGPIGCKAVTLKTARQRNPD